jgi:hypothetical protein
MVMRVACIIFLNILFHVETLAQSKDIFRCLTLNASKCGIIFSNYNYFNKIGILLQDTCSSFNRFDRNFYSGVRSLTTPAFYYRAIIVDSTTAISIEAQPKESSKYRSNKMKKNIANVNKKFIRLYAGFVNEVGDTCVVIQYVTNREYLKDKYYCKQLNLIAEKRRSLRFAVFEKIVNKWVVRSSFPYDF